MRLAAIGTGYVGLVTGHAFANSACRWSASEEEAKNRAAAAQRDPYEPGLEGLVSANVAARRLCFATELKPAIAGAEACSSLSAPRRGAATGMLIFPVSLPPPRKSALHSLDASDSIDSDFHLDDRLLP
jgi:hypothetical protein